MFEMMRKHRPTIFYGVPSLYTALLAHPDIGKGAGSDRLRHLRLGRRSAARPYRRALAQDRRRRRARRHRLDRVVADVPEQPPRRHPLRLDRQAGARLRGAHRRREGPRARRRRDRRTDRARAVGRRRLLEPARQEPPHLRRRMDLYRRQISAATPTATITTAAAPTTCSRSAACGCRRSTSRPR